MGSFRSPRGRGGSLSFGLDAGTYRWGTGWDLSWALFDLDGVDLRMSDVLAKPIIRLRAPVDNKPEFLIVLEVDGKQKSFVVPISFAQLRTHTGDCVKALMRFPVKEVPLE